MDSFCPQASTRRNSAQNVRQTCRPWGDHTAVVAANLSPRLHHNISAQLACSDHLPFQSSTRPSPSQERVKDAIHQLKYRNQVNLAEPLGKLLGKSLEVAEVGFKPDCIIPVPLHPGRLKKRGYNQALEISRPLARKMQVPIDTTLLQRTLKTPPQQGLTAAERRSNLRNAFIVTTTTSARNILLVDDVMTTGETVRECCRVLMKNNIAEVQVAVIGRA